jgi:Cdc6-like AAA superfamily ATPase
MVNDLFKWQDYEAKLSRAFSPATAISMKAYFRGRLAVLRRVIDAANQAGQHVMIYGERGVGKTSLANVIAAYLEPFTSEEIASFKVNCFRESSFSSIWRQFFRYLDVGADSLAELTPNDVLEALPKHRKLILIVDEFDRVETPDVAALLADTIKALSDFEVDTTMVVVGVADNVDDLIGQHESIDRCLVQVHLPRMEFRELMEIVEQGMAMAGMTISPDAASQICTLSLGLPHYPHWLGLASGRAAVDAKRTNVEPGDVNTAVHNLLRDVQQTILKKFDAATASPRRENFYFQVLLACALAPTDHLGRFRAADVREPYSEIMKRRHDIPAFSRHLHDLSTDKRGNVLQRFGESHNFRFRFTDPMMQPYVLMQGLQRGLVGLEAVRPRNV